MEDVKTISDLAQLGAGIAMGFGAIGAGLGIGVATKGLMDAISRQPEIAGKAVGFFLVGAALAEACAIYALVIAMKLSGMMGQCYGTTYVDTTVGCLVKTTSLYLDYKLRLKVKTTSKAHVDIGSAAWWERLVGIKTTGSGSK